MNLVIIYFALKYKGYFHDIYQAIKNKEYIPIEELQHIDDLIQKNEINAITIIDDDYPDSLKKINNPPFVLFFQGNKQLLNDEKIFLTGDFNNENINNFIDQSIEEISKKYVFVSNYSKGLDEAIINKIKKQKAKIIFISPNGLINPYFANELDIEKFDKDSFLIISEYPNNVNLNKKRLFQRNRISIGLSESLILASSQKESKLLSLVSCALEQGKDVFCYPGLQDDNDGNNLLIQDGATMITSIKCATFKN